MAAALRSLKSVRQAARVATCQARSTNQREFYTDAVASGANALYLESLYGQWKTNPNSVSAEWGKYFDSAEAGKSAVAPSSSSALSSAAARTGVSAHGGGLQNLIRAYQKRGHEHANLDPLGLHEWRTIFGSGPVDELDPGFHGFSEADMDKPVEVSLQGVPPGATLRQVIDSLKNTYSSTAGFEYTHILDHQKVDWIRSKVEDPNFLPKDKAKLLDVYTKLCKVDTFEKFLTTKFKTTKRFGIDGGEATVAGCEAAVEKAVEMGVSDVVIGMPHRGRLNILTNVVHKPLAQMFAEFKGTHYDFDKLMDTVESTDWAFAGDVKYHLGTSNRREFSGGKTATVTLECNPSHLETVGSVTLGRTRAKQYYAGNTVAERSSILPIIFHGDASLAGQGICYESMQMAHVQEFDVGGTIHVVVNNQVGFTTDPVDDRSTMYCSDIGKGFGLPIFHVNADDPIAVARVFELAAEWRQTFQTDVIIDVVCYRRYGHNESLNPDYTQPTLYQKIAKHPRAESIYAEKLISSGVATKDELDAISQSIWKNHEDCFAASDDYHEEETEWVASKWEGFAKPYNPSKADPTGVDMELLKKIAGRMFEPPEGFTMYRGLARQFQRKQEMIASGEVDWGTAELMAWASLLLEGTHVRITGQDVQPGTFAHRHCVATDQKTGEKYCFMNNLNLGTQEKLVARNSILAEYAVLGFELGYSYENPNALNIWEAQFGDFANTAQVMIDQFISAGEHKWLQQTGLVMLLPHGYEGQGAEHSSARLERFLQMSDDDEDDIPDFAKDFGRNQTQKANWQVVNVTTPSNLFHVLRRQLHRNFRKPLVVMSTKSLFNHKLCRSPLSDLSDSHFWRLLGERDEEIAASPEKVDRLVFCTGKLYYSLLQERETMGLKNVAIVSVEQIAPFPFDRVLEQLKLYDNVSVGDGVTPGNIIWCQEEPKNMGAWFYVRPRIITTFREGLDKDVVVRYVGRRAAASPATGFAKLHQAEQDSVVREALLGDAPDPMGRHRPSGLLGHQT